nr:non-ribosomal peptide synthetase [Myxococcus sp. MH1]
MKPEARSQTIPRRQGDGPTPVSYAQRRLWFLDRLAPNSPTYNMPFTLHLAGPLDVEALRRAFELLTHRHEILRTTFEEREGEAFLRVHPPSAWAMPVVDLSGSDPDARTADARRLADEEARRPFDLERGPLFRTTLLKLDAAEHVLLVNMHHIISDGWSTGLMMREFAAQYEALRQGRTASLPELPVQYGDYAAWQRERFTGGTLERQLAYWSKQLADVPSSLRLPTDRPRPVVATDRGAELVVKLPPKVAEAVKSFAMREGATPFMVLLAGFQVLMSRLSGQDDLVVGALIAGRTHRELEGLLGFFVNTLVLRADLSGDPTVEQLIGRVMETTLGAFANQDVPFEMLVEKLAPPREPGRPPLIQVLFTFQNSWASTLRLEGLTATPMEVYNGRSKFDLTLQMGEKKGSLEAAFTYNVNLFDAATIERIGRQYTTLLERLCAAPAKARCSTLGLLDEETRRSILEEWNATTTELPRDRCVHELFEEQVARRPDAIAVEFEEERLTYRELNARANRVAYALRERGVKPETRVGLCVERSSGMVAAVLGILKAGGAYVPLDPRHPLERLAFMARDVGLRLVVASRAHRGVAEKLGEVLELGTWVEASGEVENPQSGATASNLLYVMYTSGSTGEPKGVAIEHRNVGRLVRGASYADFGPEEVFLQLAPLAFDASTFELWGSLLNGGRLVVHPPHDPTLSQLATLVKQRGVTTLWLTAGLFHQFVDEDARSLAHVRQVLAGGDALSPGHVRRFLEVGGRRLINGYGPTETTTFACCHAVEHPEQVGESVPIGRPISNTTAYVVDTRGELVPVGVAGELWIGGEGVGRGYWNQPELTATRFVENRWGPGRVYRTGDRVRWRADGTLEFLGRIDFQVKLRGFRIEPGEIESVLRRHPGVRDALVLVREHGPGDKQLVAYVTVHPQGTPPTRESLREHLPEYMVPSALITLESFPLTANGKVDRKALPAPEGLLPSTEYVAPRNPTEERLADLWAEVLRVPRVGVLDDFFALGGHSLLATQLISRIRARLGVELPLRALFEAPTLASFAERLEAAPRVEAPPLVRRPRAGPVPLSFAQQRLWFIDQLEPGSATYNIPVAVRLRGPLDVDALRRTFEALVVRHESLRTTFPMEQGQPLQLIAPQVTLPLSVVDLRALPTREAEATRLAREEALRPFDLTKGPLLRTTLLQLGEQEHILLLTMHHIVSDGWSMGVLVRELGALYEGFASGHGVTLPPLPMQYADFALWQRDWLQGEVLEGQLAWWKQYLEGAAVLELPTDRARPAVLSARGAVIPVHLCRELSDAVLALAQREGTTPFMTLLAAFQVLLARYSGQEDISVGSPIAGRTRAETEGLIGFFVNTLVLRTQLRRHASFRELLSEVRTSTLAAFQHQDVPFEKLVEVIQPARDLSRSPLFQAFFALQNAPLEPLRLPGLSFEPMPAVLDTAKFDLTLSFIETPTGFEGELEYSVDLFDPATVARMAEHLRVLLEGAVAHPETALRALPLLTAREQQQLLIEWNDTRAEYPSDACIHHLFEARVRQAPEALSVGFEDERLTYRELNERANRLARHLRGLGVGPEVLVGLCVERSPDMVVGLLGILKSEGAWLPLDPTLPRERLAFMVQDSGARVLLTQKALRERVPGAFGHVVFVEETRSREQGGDLGLALPSRALAYVIYTSGSTGRPKGTLVEHQSVCNLVVQEAEVFGLGPGSRLLQFANLGFDLSVEEILTTLCAGATLWLAPVEKAIPGPALHQLLRDAAITTLSVTPATLALTPSEGLPALRTVISGGEACGPELVARWAPGRRFLNSYGPTEATVLATFAECETNEGTPPIGRPLANVRAYVLDAALQPVPVGVKGELFLGGVGVARGYLGRPELTADRFLPDPFNPVPGARMYRTGDLVRYLPTGDLDFIGRIDTQVKLRGFRIELGEIESTLLQHAAVRAAVVLAREDSHGARRLVAYLVLAPGQELEVDSFRAFLGKHLPEYMVPAAFIPMEELPLTANGKVDKKALPVPDASHLHHREYVAPRDALEQVLANLFEELLDVRPVGLHGDFFGLGGHSLLAVRLMTQLQQRTGRTIPLSALFQSSTVERLATKLRGDEAPWSPLVPIQPRGNRPPFFCVHPVGGNVLCYAELARHMGSQQPFYGLQAQGLDGRLPPLESLPEMAALYVQHVRAVQPRGPYRLGGWSLGAVIAYEMAQQLKQQGETVEVLVLIEPSPTSYARGAPIEGDALWAEFTTDLARTTGTPVESSEPQLRPLMKVFTANSRALHQHALRPWLGHLTVVLGADTTDAEEMPLPSRGWAALATQATECIELPGDHYSLLRPPYVEALARLLTSLLEQPARRSMNG